MNKMIEVVCPKCSQSRLMRLSNYKRGGETGLCLPCYNKNHASNTILHDGYVLIKKPDHPRARYLGFVKRAVLVMEDKLGRPLLPSEHIHHLNSKRDDDRPENLIILTNNEHAKLHMTKNQNIKNRYEMALTQR